MNPIVPDPDHADLEAHALSTDNMRLHAHTCLDEGSRAFAASARWIGTRTWPSSRPDCRAVPSVWDLTLKDGLMMITDVSSGSYVVHYGGDEIKDPTRKAAKAGALSDVVA